MKNLKILARVGRELAEKKGKFLALTCLGNSLVGHISRGCSDHGPEITILVEDQNRLVYFFRSLLTITQILKKEAFSKEKKVIFITVIMMIMHDS